MGYSSLTYTKALRYYGAYEQFYLPPIRLIHERNDQHHEILPFEHSYREL